MSLFSPPIPTRFNLGQFFFAISLPVEGASFEADGEDRVLAKRAAKDTAAFSQLYRRYVRRVYAYHLARTGNVQDAQDLTSQTFVAALESISRFRCDGSFAAWLFGIAYHKVNDHYRRLRIELPLEIAEKLSHPADSPEEMAHLRMEVEQVSQGMRLLSRDRAEAVALSVFGGLTIEETCRVLGKSTSAVKILIYRGIQDLRARLVRRIGVEE